MLYLKKLAFVLLILLGNSSWNNAFSQSTPVPDKRIVEAFGQKHVDFLLKNNPNLILYYNFYLENAWKFIELPADKMKGLPKLELQSQYKNTKSSKFNLLLYQVKRYYDRENYYVYNGKVLLLLSEENFMKLYNEYKKNQR